MGKETYGITPRGNSIQISFSYMGRRFRETLPLTPTKTNIGVAKSLRETIRSQIVFNKFNYLEHFPNGAKAKQFINNSANQLSIKSALNNWIKSKARTLSLSTLNGYSAIINSRLIPTFGEMMVSELSKSKLDNWIVSMNCSPKRINNILTPLRQTFEDLYCEEIISRNPFARLKNLAVTSKEPNPFTPNEINAILNNLDGQNLNLIQFAFYTGLRTSELIALKWKYINFKEKSVYVCIAKVRGQIKKPKTASGIRKVTLSKQAMIALKSQLDFTRKSEFVFNDPNSNLPWKDDQPIRKRVWKPALKKARIVYRVPYQTRHTFASMHLSEGKNPLWVAQQMGHKNWAMIIKVYGRWLEYK